MSTDDNALFDLVLMDYLDKDPIIAKFFSQILVNWPTSPQNIGKSCSLYQRLNPNGLVVSGLDPNCDYYKFCCEYAYITLSLKQRGLINITYYLTVDELLNASNNSSIANGMKGGLSLKQILSTISLFFILLGMSEGLDVVPSTTGSMTPTGKNTLIKSTTSPVSKPAELLPYRQAQAESTLTSMMAVAPWILPQKQVVIANGINQQQIDYFTDKITELNIRLQSASREAQSQCENIVGQLRNRDIFSEEDFYQRVLLKANEDIEQQSAQSTSSIIQSGFAYTRKGASNLYTNVKEGITGTAPSEREVNEEDAINRAYEVVVSEQNQAMASHIEKTAYALQYQMLCRAGTPLPQFLLDTSDDSIKMNTRFGNEYTSELLLAHISTIQRIQDKMKTMSSSDPQYMPLQSLKEKIEVEVQLIESSTLFVPLDIMPGFQSVQASIIEGTVTTSKFEQLTEQIGEYLPLTQQDFQAQSAIRKNINQMKSQQRQQTAEEWKALATDVTKGVTNVAAATVEIVADTTLDLAEHVATKGIDTTTTIGVKGATGLTKVGKTLIGGIGEIVMENLLPIGIVGGFVLVAMAATVIFKNKMLSLPPSQQKQIEQEKNAKEKELENRLKELEERLNQLQPSALLPPATSPSPSSSPSSSAQQPLALQPPIFFPTSNTNRGGKKYTRRRKYIKHKKSKTHKKYKRNGKKNKTIKNKNKNKSIKRR